MPIYDYKCKTCGTVQEMIFTMTDKPDTVERPCVTCQCEREFASVPSAPAIVSGVAGRMTVPSDFKNRLEQIKQHYPNMQSSIV